MLSRVVPGTSLTITRSDSARQLMNVPLPPVSVSSTNRRPTGTTVLTRSRVTPAVGSTMAIRRPASQLNSDDLPTLGRPTMATTGTDTVTPPCSDARTGVRVNTLLYQ